MDREELHHRVMLLKEKAEAGKIHVMEHLAGDLWESLRRVRIASDGLVDPDSVDARVRALSLGMMHFHQREEIKQEISLREIQEAFFARMDFQFGDLFRTMKERGADPREVAAGYASDADLVRSTAKGIPGFLDEIREFWDGAFDPAWIHSEDQLQLKAVYGGSLFPEPDENIASSCGLYTDTIYLPDPLLKISSTIGFSSQKKQVYDLLRLGLEVLNYRDLALADVDPPIVVILPDLHGLDESYQRFIASVSNADCLRHSASVFGRDFESVDELRDYGARFGSVDDLLASLAHPERLLFNTDATEPLREQIERYLQGEGSFLPLRGPGDVVFAQAISRMSQANDVLQRSRRLRGTPLIDAETSWRYFTWKLEYDSDLLSSDDPTSLHIVRGLQHASRTDMEWIGRIPRESLIEIRQKGATEEIRKILTRGVHEIAEAGPTNFFRASDQIVSNIQDAFDQHQRNLRELSGKKWKFAGRDIGSWVAVGTLEIAAALGGAPLYGLGAIASNQLLDVPKLRDLPGKAKAIRAESLELQDSAVGLLFKQRGKA